MLTKQRAARLKISRALINGWTPRNSVPNPAMISHPGGISETELLEVAAYVWAVGRGAVKP